jgi:uncharacterized integral membrane protein
MWLVRVFLTGAIFAAVLLFAIQNVQEWTDIRLLPGTIYHVQLVFALFVAFVLGSLLWFFVSVAREFRTRREIMRLRREAQRLRDELTALRNLPLEDAVADDIPLAIPGA